MSDTTTWYATGPNLGTAANYYNLGLNSAISGQYYMQEGTGENITIPAQYQADYDQGYGAGSDQTQ